MTEEHTGVLLVEDIPLYVTLLQRLLDISGINVKVANTLQEGLVKAEADQTDIILLDLGLPDCQGLDTFRSFKDQFPDIPIVILTGLDDESVAANAVQEGAQDYLVKGPYLLKGEAGQALLLRSLRYAIERQQIQAALRRDRDLLEKRVAERTTELQEANLKLRWYYDHLNILREIDHATLEAKSSEEMARIALKHFGRLVPHSYADILVFGQLFPLDPKQHNYQADQVTLIAQKVNGNAQTTGELFLSTDLIINERLRRGKQYLINDLNALLKRTPFEERLNQRGVRSYLMVPLIAEGELIGVINLGQDKPHTFTDVHVDSALQVASQLALMLHSAQLLEQVRASQTRLRYLTDRLVSAQEDERQRISLELHDDAGQALTALKIKLSLIRSGLPEKSEETQEQLTDAIDLTSETMDRIRSLAHDLRPPSLAAVGINQSMEDFCQRITKHTGLFVDYAGEELYDLPGYYEISLYRVLQEALTNVVKHAQASLATVRLGIKDAQIFLEIADNGIGFDPPNSSQMEEKDGLGLLGILERIEALGGTLELSSQSNRGTTLLVQVPRRGKG